MFVDASALVAILEKEARAPELLRVLGEEGGAATSALAIFETTSALVRKRTMSVEAALAEIDAFVLTARIRIVPIGENESREALRAFARYGKGRGHPAQLNMGDCFAYACARTLGIPLLFIGNDFVRTDVHSAM